MDSFLNDSFRGFVSCKQKSQKIRFVSICKDLCTNPASLFKTLKLSRTLTDVWPLILYEETHILRDRQTETNEVRYNRQIERQTDSHRIINIFKS